MKGQVLHTVWCNIAGEAAGEIWNWLLLGVKGLRLVYTFDFSCDFAYKTQATPRGFQSRNAATKYRQVSRNWKEGCLQKICDNFLSDPRDASRKKHSCRVT